MTDKKRTSFRERIWPHWKILTRTYIFHQKFYVTFQGRKKFDFEKLLKSKIPNSN